MDTHLHLVVETPEPTLGKGMQRLLGRHAFAFNRRHGRYGHVFADRYAASLIKNDDHAISLCTYVALNPVRAGLVAKPEDWEWSSYRASAGLIRPPRFLETRLVPAMLHPDRKRAQVLYRELAREKGKTQDRDQAKA